MAQNGHQRMADTGLSAINGAVQLVLSLGLGMIRWNRTWDLHMESWTLHDVSIVGWPLLAVTDRRTLAPAAVVFIDQCAWAAMFPDKYLCTAFHS